VAERKLKYHSRVITWELQRVRQ